MSPGTVAPVARRVVAGGTVGVVAGGVVVVAGGAVGTVSVTVGIVSVTVSCVWVCVCVVSVRELHAEIAVWLQLLGALAEVGDERLVGGRGEVVDRLLDLSQLPVDAVALAAVDELAARRRSGT